MPNKDRLLVLLQTLQDQSDDEAYLTTADLRAALEKEGHECSVRTLRRDMESLQNCGYNIEVREKPGMPTEYAYLGRQWSMKELQILVDAVSAAQFIPPAKSRNLIAKLSVMAGPSYVKELVPQILVSERVKAKNAYMLYSVHAIRKAIDRNRKIAFQYLRFTAKGEQVPKQEKNSETSEISEKWYTVSPYATVWNDDRYYLVGWSDRDKAVRVYRVDRMKDAKQLPERRVPPPEKFDIRDYTDKVFRMYGGPEEKVTLRFSAEILDQVFDRFGDGIRPEPAGRNRYRVTVPVSLSTTFYAWVFQFVGQMSVAAPEHVREAYAGYLGQALDDVLGD